MKNFMPVAVFSLIALAGCSAYGPLSSGASSTPNERFIPSSYYMPNYTENDIYNGFSHANTVPDLRYQYALLQQPEIQEQLNTIIRNHPEGTSRLVGNVGRVALHVEPTSSTYYSHKTKSLCRELQLNWQDLNNKAWLNKQKQIVCQIGPQLEWLPLG